MSTTEPTPEDRIMRMSWQNAAQVTCPLCGKDARFHPGDPINIACDVCGRFGMTFELTVDRDMQGQPHPYLSAATRKAYESRRPLILDMNNWQLLEDEQRSIRVSEKLNDLLRLIAKRSGTPGQVCKIVGLRDYPLIAARDDRELETYLLPLERRGFLFPPQPYDEGTIGCRLTIPGWEVLEPALTSGAVPGRCFIAMAFRPALETAFQDGMRAAVEKDCGFTAIRMLELEHNDKICDRIIVEVRRAQFVIADFTFQRGGVYFEAGFAAALGRPVIWTCKACHFRHLHFDTRQYNHIKWEEASDLRRQLAARIRGTIPGAKLN
jgi:hypothetical protein